MRIYAKYMEANTQIHTGKCYFLGLLGRPSKKFHIYNVETSGSVADANKVAYLHDGGDNSYMLPKPGVECTNGLYCLNSSNPCIVYYSI